MNRAFQDITGETFKGEVRGNFFVARFLRCHFDKARFIRANLCGVRFEDCTGLDSIKLTDRCRADGIVGLDVDKATEDGKFVGVLFKGKVQLPLDIENRIKDANKCQEYEDAVEAKTVLTAELIERKAYLDTKCARELAALKTVDPTLVKTMIPVAIK